MSLVVSANAETNKKFTSSDILKWENPDQDNYFSIAIGMAGVVAAQNPGGRANCVDNWYFKDNKTKQKRNNYIREIMRKYPEYHPDGILIGVLEKACGSFNFSQLD